MDELTKDQYVRIIESWFGSNTDKVVQMMEQLKPFIPEINLRDMIWFCSVGAEESKIHISFLINFVDWIESEENKIKALDILHTLYQVNNKLYDACWFRFKQTNIEFVNSE